MTNNEKKIYSKLIFSPEWTDEKLYLTLKKVVKESAKKHCKENWEPENYYVEQPQDCQHKFVLPPSIRNGQINFDNISDWFLCNGWDSLNKDSDEIFLRPSSIEKAIEFLFEDQEDDDYDINRETGFREKSLRSCEICKQKVAELIDCGTAIYSCCDQVHPVQKSWFDVRHSYCEDCRSFFVKGEEELIDTILLDNCLPKELVSIVKNYLPFCQSLFTMQKASITSYKNTKKQKAHIKPMVTSVLTEWLPFFQYGEDYDGLTILFVNCNPDSKFYSTTFFYQHEGWNNKIISLNTF
jgi:hypothetical protein